MPKILIAESLDAETYKTIANAHRDIEFIYQPDITENGLEKELCQYQGLIVRPKAVSAAAIMSAPELKLIVRGGVGVNSIDLAAAKKSGVVVENTPGLNSTATAEFTFALMMELVAKRQIRKSYQDVLQHKTSSPDHYFGTELAGKSIGIMGLGNVGMALVKRCAAFEMEVYGYNRSKKTGAFTFCSTIETLLKNKLDIIALHLSLTSETNTIMDERVFEMLKPGTILLNTARPQLIEVQAFKKALEKGLLASAGIDGDLDLIAPFVQADTEKRCLFTHHIADATCESRIAITKQVMEQVVLFFKEGVVINRV